MKYKIILFTFLVFLSSCLSEKMAVKKINQIAKYYPHLINEKTDTIIDVVEITKEVFIKPDTSLLFEKWNDKINDSVTYNIIDSAYNVEVTLVRDTFVKVSVRTEIIADTLLISLTDTIEKTIIQKEYTTKLKKYIPFWIYLLIFVLIVLIFIIITKLK